MLDTLIIALVVSIPMAAAGWLVGICVDRLGAGPALRGRVWGLALVASAAVTPVALVVDGLNVRSPIAIARPNHEAPALVPDFTSAPAPEPVPVVVSAPISAAIAGEPTARAAPQLRPADLAPFLPLGLFLIFALGVAIRWMSLAYRLGRLARHVSISGACEDGELTRRLHAEAYRLGVTAPRLRLHPDPGAPFLTGVARPVIILPRPLLETLAPEPVSLILAHELAHLKARDNWRALGEEILLGAFWFNPIMPLLRNRMGIAREQVCDALALNGAGRRVRHAYAEMLFALLKEGGVVQPALAFPGDNAQVVQRMRAILHPGGRFSLARHFTTGALSGVLAAAVLALPLAFAAQPLPPSAVSAPYLAGPASDVRRPTGPNPGVALAPNAIPRGAPPLLAADFVGEEPTVASFLTQGAALVSDVVQAMAVADSSAPSRPGLEPAVLRSSPEPAGVMLDVRVVEIDRGLIARFVDLAGPVIDQRGGRLHPPADRAADIEAVLSGLGRQGVVRVLSTRRFNAMSGEVNQLRLGGDVLAPVGRDATGAPTMVAKPYGASLNIAANILSGGRIGLTFTTRSSEFETHGAFDGGQDASRLIVSALDFRSAENTVDLPAGGSLMIAGLLRQQAAPYGEAMQILPVLGRLYRSAEFLKGETELVMVVSPVLPAEVWDFADRDQACRAGPSGDCLIRTSTAPAPRAPGRLVVIEGCILNNGAAQPLYYAIPSGASMRTVLRDRTGRDTDMLLTAQVAGDDSIQLTAEVTAEGMATTRRQVAVPSGRTAALGVKDGDNSYTFNITPTLRAADQLSALRPRSSLTCGSLAGGSPAPQEMQSAGPQAGVARGRTSQMASAAVRSQLR